MRESISIKVNSLSKKLGKNQALDNISLYFKSGQMHGVIGPEGAGKTTLMRCILNLLKPNTGNVEFLQEQSGSPLSPEEIRLKVAYMPQQQSLYPDLSVDEHLDFFKTLYQIEPEIYQARRAALLEITQLAAFVDRPAGQLSGGMSKKLGLMCALLRSPEILLLDEPTNGVDPISRREFWDLLYKLLDKKILIIVSTAYMDEAERCGIVHLLSSGKVIAEGNPSELLKTAKMTSFDKFFIKHEHADD